VALVFIAFALLPLHASTQSVYPADAGESIRDAFFDAQMELPYDAKIAQQKLADAHTAYQSVLMVTFAADVPELNQRLQMGFSEAQDALVAKDGVRFAAARATVWTTILAGSYAIVEQALKKGDGHTARLWLSLREFRQATRFSHPDTDATVAVDDVIAKKISFADALVSVHADLLDTYQARLTDALHELTVPGNSGFPIKYAEQSALAEGYFTILAPIYGQQRGQKALMQVQQALQNIHQAAVEGKDLDPSLTVVEDAIQNFRAAPLSVTQRTRRIGQLFRFLSLIPIEYGRGVSNGVVTRDFEIREAITFHDGAEAAFADLQNLFNERNASKTQQAKRLLTALAPKLEAATSGKQVVAPDTIQTTTQQLTMLLKEIIPSEWQQQDSNGDFDVITSMLDQMVAAVARKEYDQAEAARLEAYSTLETGPEARLTAFAPQMIKPIEDLFWYGQDKHKGLAYLISHKASLREIRATCDALDIELAVAQKAIMDSNTPFAVAVNAAVIVFREGLESVLILASLMGSLKHSSTRRYQRPLWLGAVLALIATVLTWLLMRDILVSFARYGESLEAIISVIAIAVLLLVTNWFFHKVYWTGWIAQFHSQKRRLLSAEAGQWVGLILLGLTSIYREGFETVLFLQALVLDAGTGVVLSGVGLGLLGAFTIGVIIFILQFKLPYKKMLIVTGIMIGIVLLIMVGNTVQVFQVVGWLPIHMLGFVQFPYWTGLWFGLYATWEGILLQVAAATFVVGSYVLAECQQKRRNNDGNTKSVIPSVKEKSLIVSSVVQ